jgi:hypothetical protein
LFTLVNEFIRTDNPVPLDWKRLWRREVKVRIEVLGLPSLARLIGKKGELEFNGSTVTDIVHHIVGRHGQKARKIMLDDDGRLDHVIQLMINNEGIMPRDHYDSRELKEGDDVKFMLLVGGG